MNSKQTAASVVALALSLVAVSAWAEKPLEEVIANQVTAAEKAISRGVAAAEEAVDKAKRQVRQRTGSNAADIECESSQERIVSGDVDRVTQIQTGECNSQSLVIGQEKK